jgi:serine/threonine protein kinase
MGANNQKAESLNKANYQAINKKEYPNICIVGEVKNKENNRNYFHFQSLYAIDSKENEAAEVSKQGSMSGIQHNGKLVLHDFEEDHQLCFQNFVLNLYFEYSSRSAARIMRELKASHKQFPEDQAWIMLNDVTEHIKSLDGIGSFHGDLQPEYIYFTDGMREARVINPLSYTKFQMGYNILLGESKTNYKTPLSPEYLSFLKAKMFYPQTDNIKADMFSLGIIVLSLLVKVDWDYFYDFQKCSVNMNEIKINLAKVIKQNYSEELFYILDQALKRDPIDRPHINEFLKMTRFKYKNIIKKVQYN